MLFSYIFGLKQNIVTQKNSVMTQPLHLTPPAKRMLLGAGIALILIAMFIYTGEQKSHPDWGNLWMVRPFIIVPMAGALGGLFFYFINNLPFFKIGWKKAIAVILGLMGYIFTLWVGTILGLSGTWWD